MRVRGADAATLSAKGFQSGLVSVNNHAQGLAFPLDGCAGVSGHRPDRDESLVAGGEAQRNHRNIDTRNNAPQQGRERLN